MALSEAEAKNQGFAWWRKGSIVEINIHKELIDDQGRPCRDPNQYQARCLTEGTWPLLEVITEDGVRHPRFPLPLEKDEYSVWREVSREFKPKRPEDYINQREVVCFKTGNVLTATALSNGIVRWDCACGARYEKLLVELPKMPARVEMRTVDGCRHWWTED